MKCKKRVLSVVLALIFALTGFGITNVVAESSDNAYYMGEVQKKKDTSYGPDKELTDKDVHYGWDLGKFKISGFTRVANDENGKPVFLKNVGDKVQLSFELEQDIEALNENDSLVISEDDNGYDELFGITKKERTNFGEGALLIKHTDYQNKTTYVEPYTNYLKGVEKGAETEVQFFEEGDYEIALDYEVREKKWGPIPDGYTHYQIKIEFSVRNGNCMVFPFDIASGNELVNTSFTESGFYLDLAKSRYLTVDVKKLNYVEADGELVEDTRFNKAATDGEKYTDSGVYIITVRNLYTAEETEKKIYVGNDPILKAFVTTGKDISYIKELVSEGAIIEEDGTIVLPTNETLEATEADETMNEESTENLFVTEDGENEKKTETKGHVNNKGIVFVSVAVVFVIFVIAMVIRRKNKKTSEAETIDSEEIIDDDSSTKDEEETK